MTLLGFISISTCKQRSHAMTLRVALFCASLLLLLSSVVESTNETSSAPNSGDPSDSKIQEEETFHDVEKKMKDAVSAAIKRLLPQIMKSGMGSISGACSSSIIKIIGGFRQLKEWAVRFLDSSGKLPPGILEGTSLSLGDFDECLDITVGKKNNPPLGPEDIAFAGQYCLVESHQHKAIAKSVAEFQSGKKDAAIATTKTFLNILIRYKHLTNSTFKLGLCIPSKCTKEDLQSILSTEALQALGKLNVAYCLKNTGTQITTHQKVILCVFGLLFLGLFIGTSCDIYSKLKNVDKEKKVPVEKPRFRLLLMRSMSLCHNCSDLLRKSESQESLLVLCGLRTMTVMSVIYGHTYGHVHELHFQKFSKPANFIRFFEDFTFSGVANASIAMDTFVFIAAVSITYNRWRKASSKGSVKLKLIELVVQMYCRISVAQLLTIGLLLLTPLIGNGPLWPAYVGPMIQNCKDRWWMNILYIENFWSSHKTCLYHTWILAVIMQLIVLSTVIIWILKRSPRVGVSIMVLLIAAGVAGVAFVTIDNDIPGGMAFYMHDVRTGVFTWRNVYILAYDHIGPFCIGLLTGYFLATKQHCFKLKRLHSLLLWCVSITCSASVIFGLYRYRNGRIKMDTTLNVLYAVAHRNVWAVGIAWLVIACTTGHGGVISKFLSARVFRVMDSLCYMAFLLHLPIMFYHSGNIRERWYMGHLEMVVLGIAYITLSFILSFMTYITCVRPYFFVESWVRGFFHCKHSMTLQDSEFKTSAVIAQSSETDNTCLSVISCKTGL